MPVRLTIEPWLHDSLAKHPVLSSLREEPRRHLVAAAAALEYAPAECIVAEGTTPGAIFALVRGTVRAFHRSTTGLEILLSRLSPPAIFGDVEALTGIASIHSVEALERSVVLRIPRSVFRATIARSRTCSTALLHDVCARLCIATQNQRMLAFYPVRARLAHFLLSQAVLDGLVAQQGLSARLPLNQDDMARSLGVTRRAIAKEIRRWQSANVISRQRDRYVILDQKCIEADAQDLRFGPRVRTSTLAVLSGRYSS